MNPLDAIEIRTPCRVPWEGMKGDERVRFCSQCRLNVYNLSELGRREAEALLQQDGGRVCVRLYRRPDGTVLTRSCRAARWARRTAALAFRTAAALVVGFFLWVSGSATLGLHQDGMAGVKRREPFRTVLEWISPTPLPPMAGLVLMGDVCVPPPPANPVLTPEGGS